MFRTSRVVTNRLAVLLLLGATILTSACLDDDTVRVGDTADVTVMTRNLYLGADIFELVTSQDPIPVTVARLFATAQANDFATRADAIAAEIEAHDPDLVGLQEVSLYRIQDPSDYVTGNDATNAEVVALDYLDILMAALDARGLDYTVVAQIENADVELPAARSQTEFFDVRLTDHDVILARSDVQTAGAGGATFQTIASLPVGGSMVEFPRGYTWTGATVDGVSFMFVNAHFEVSSTLDPRLTTVQAAQAYELTSAFGRMSPVVMVGDFNTPPGEPPYNILTASFADAWSAAGSGEGLTCCQPEFLWESRDLYQRIDLILSRGAIEVLSAEVIGEDPADRVPSVATGQQALIWPSDHAGVVATLRIHE